MDTKALGGDVGEYVSVTLEQLGINAEDAIDANVGDYSSADTRSDGCRDSGTEEISVRQDGWSMDQVLRWLELRIENNSLAGVPRAALCSAIPSELLQKVALKLDVHKVQREAWRNFMEDAKEDFDGAPF